MVIIVINIMVTFIVLIIIIITIIIISIIIIIMIIIIIINIIIIKIIHRDEHWQWNIFRLRSGLRSTSASIRPWDEKHWPGGRVSLEEALGKPWGISPWVGARHWDANFRPELSMGIK